MVIESPIVPPTMPNKTKNISFARSHTPIFLKPSNDMWKIGGRMKESRLLPTLPVRAAIYANCDRNTNAIAAVIMTNIVRIMLPSHVFS